MEDSDSLMSYNIDHWTNFYEPSQYPGILLPEDIRCLALNKRVFNNLYFDPEVDITFGYDLRTPKSTFRADIIPEQPDATVNVTTNDGEINGSRVLNAVLGFIKKSK